MFFNDYQFYPTPENLIFEMTKDLDFDNIETILEPSAGKGDIVDGLIKKRGGRYKYNKELDVDVIEIEPNLQNILRGKKYKLIHDNFLTLDTHKHYDLIIMNPPFDNGDKHLLKALDMQERSGGQVICILNAETIKNPFNNTRQDLLKRLNSYSAQIQFKQEAFKDAERSTDVEIALIKVELPTPKNSFFFDALEKASKQEEYIYEDQQTSVTYSDIAKRLVAEYNYKARILTTTLYEIDKLLANFDKQETELLKLEKVSINTIIREIRGIYWSKIFSAAPEFKKNLTSKLANELYSRMNELKNYDFSYFNIQRLIQELFINLSKSVEETILELFDTFSYKHHYGSEFSSNVHYYNGWKTNDAFKVNKKVIINLNIFRKWRSSNNISYYFDYSTERKILDMEKTMDYLAGVPSDHNALSREIDKIKASESTYLETKYFTIQFYKKGSAHITFKDLDLLKKFNIFAAQRKNWIPPTYGSKQYKDMSAEEKAVIDSFEGEKSYKETMENKEKFLLPDGVKIQMLAG